MVYGSYVCLAPDHEYIEPDDGTNACCRCGNERDDYQHGTCQSCEGEMTWCNGCRMWSRTCCVEFGTCECS